jgi:hypothetical protein
MSTGRTMPKPRVYHDQTPDCGPYGSDLRLAVDAMLTPLQFVLLVIRQFYGTVWETSASHLRAAVLAVQAISDSDVVPAYRKGRDFLEGRR